MSSCCEWPCPSIVSNATIASSHATSATNRSSHASSARTSRHVRPTSAPGLLVPHLCRDRLASAIPVETDSPTSALGPDASHRCQEPHPGRCLCARVWGGQSAGRRAGGLPPHRSLPSRCRRPARAWWSNAPMAVRPLAIYRAAPCARTSSSAPSKSCSALSVTQAARYAPAVPERRGYL